MTRLLAVLLLTIVAFLVATYTWNRTPHVTCTLEGLIQAGSVFTELAEKHPRKARQELVKLANRTGIKESVPTIDRLIESWSAESTPNPRTCRRLRESLARLR